MKEASIKDMPAKPSIPSQKVLEIKYCIIQFDNKIF